MVPKGQIDQLTYILELTELEGGISSVVFTGCDNYTESPELLAKLMLESTSTKRKWLLIDADFSQTILYSRFKIDLSSPGLIDTMEFAVDKLDIESFIIKISESRFILPSGATKQSSVVRARPGLIEDVISKLKDKFDLILIWAKPVLADSQTRFLIESVDKAILLTKSGHTEKEYAKRAISIINANNEKLLGVVLL